MRSRCARSTSTERHPSKRDSACSTARATAVGMGQIERAGRDEISLVFFTIGVDRDAHFATVVMARRGHLFLRSWGG